MVLCRANWLKAANGSGGLGCCWKTCCLKAVGCSKSPNRPVLTCKLTAARWTLQATASRQHRRHGISSPNSRKVCDTVCPMRVSSNPTTSRPSLRGELSLPAVFLIASCSHVSSLDDYRLPPRWHSGSSRSPRAEAISRHSLHEILRCEKY